MDHNVAKLNEVEIRARSHADVATELRKATIALQTELQHPGKLPDARAKAVDAYETAKIRFEALIRGEMPKLKPEDAAAVAVLDNVRHSFWTKRQTADAIKRVLNLLSITTRA